MAGTKRFGSTSLACSSSERSTSLTVLSCSDSSFPLVIEPKTACALIAHTVRLCTTMTRDQLKFNILITVAIALVIYLLFQPSILALVVVGACLNVVVASYSGNDSNKSTTSSNSSSTTIPLHMATLNGNNFTISVERNASVTHVKGIVEQIVGIPIDAQRLICKGVQLGEEGTLDQFHIEKDAKIIVVERLRGC
jgi:predicted membrane-bound dolichyl-phosphate-mannose-protein mannosyltransferase